jgi:hypothetical protein
MAEHDPVTIGIVSISDRASSGVYEDKGLPALKEWLGKALKNPITFQERLIPDEKERISATLVELVDAGCSLVLTTGGTGPARATSRRKRRWRSRTRKCPASANRCGRSACASCRRRSCRGRWR